jgi:hypothetical protein
MFAEMRAHVGRSPAARCFAFHSYYDHDRVGCRRSTGTILPAIAPASPSRVRQLHAAIDAGTTLGKIVVRL